MDKTREITICFSSFSPVVAYIAQPRPDLWVHLDVLGIGLWVVERFITRVAVEAERKKILIWHKVNIKKKETITFWSRAFAACGALVCPCGQTAFRTDHISWKKSLFHWMVLFLWEMNAIPWLWSLWVVDDGDVDLQLVSRRALLAARGTNLGDANNRFPPFQKYIPNN